MFIYMLLLNMIYSDVSVYREDKRAVRWKEMRRSHSPSSRPVNICELDA